MLLPHSMDYLMRGGVLDFDAAAYVEGASAISPCNTNMLGNIYAKGQPKKDTFTSYLKSKLTDKNFLKKAAAVVVAATLSVAGFKKCKNCIDSVKNFFKSKVA